MFMTNSFNNGFSREKSIGKLAKLFVKIEDPETSGISGLKTFSCRWFLSYSNS